MEDQIAIVTGAKGNLGPIWSQALLESGARVVAIDLAGAVPTDRFGRLTSEYDSSRLLVVDGDVCDRPSVEAALNECKSSYGIPTVLVNNAGLDQPPTPGQSNTRVEDVPYEISKRIFEVNVLGLFLVAQVVGAEMVKEKKGSIINVGSLYASVAPDSRFYDHLPGDPPFLKPPAYGASKAAVVNLTHYLAALWARYGIRVNTLSPGGIEGGQDDEFRSKFSSRVPMGRMGMVDELMGPLLFLASDASSYVTGINLQVDGGFTLW